MTDRPHSIVVGGSRGIGRVLARSLGASGDLVSVVSRQPGPDAPPGSRHFAVDLQDANGLSTALAAATKFGGPFTRLFFLQRYRGSGIDASADWHGEIETSIEATRQAIDELTSGRPPSTPGSVVVVSSLAAELVVLDQPLAYHIAKAALNQIVRFYAVKLADTGIRVNGVVPGQVLKEEAEDFYRQNARLYEARARHTPLRRMGTAQEIANVMMFLCSDAASFVSGQMLVVDGGLSLIFQGSLATDPEA